MKDLGFPRGRALAKQQEFRKLYRTGRKISSEYLSVYSCPVEGRGGRVGIVAGKRVGKAVERNRIRRILRETVRKNQHSINEKTDLAIVVRPAALKLSRYELAEQLLLLLRKSGAI